jgi:hypothetical protein
MSIEKCEPIQIRDTDQEQSIYTLHKIVKQKHKPKTRTGYVQDHRRDASGTARGAGNRVPPLARYLERVGRSPIVKGETDVECAQARIWLYLCAWGVLRATMRLLSGCEMKRRESSFESLALYRWLRGAWLGIELKTGYRTGIEETGIRAGPDCGHLLQHRAIL